MSLLESNAGEPVDVPFSGETVTLAPEEILVETYPAEGLATATAKHLTVAIDAVISPALRSEGLAREVVRRVQAMRKNAEFNIEDRITTWVMADEELQSVIRQWVAYIQVETLTTTLHIGDPLEGVYVEDHQIEGMGISIGIRQN